MKKIKTGHPLSEREKASLTAYLNEIGKEVLLADEEECALAQQIKAGGKQAERAANKLVSANLRFVVAVAKQYTGEGMSIADLISEGNMALLKAAYHFDGARGLRFVGYAEPFVRKAMEQALNVQSGIISLPKNEKNAQEQENSRAFSVDAPLQNGKQVSLGSTLTDDSVARPDQQVLADSVKEELLQAMEILNEREQQVVASFYGINTPHLTFAEIGMRMGLKRERVRQIRKQAMRKLSRHTNSEMLRVYFA